MRLELEFKFKINSITKIRLPVLFASANHTELQLVCKNDFCTPNFNWPATDAQASWRSSSKSVLRASRTSNPNSIPRVRAWYASVYACWCALEESVPVQVLRLGIVIEQLQNFRWQHVAELLQMLFHQCIAFSFQL